MDEKQVKEMSEIREQEAGEAVERLAEALQ